MYDPAGLDHLHSNSSWVVGCENHFADRRVHPYKTFASMLSITPQKPSEFSCTDFKTGYQVMTLPTEHNSNPTRPPPDQNAVTR